MINVIKRDGSLQEFNKQKIVDAIKKANDDTIVDCKIYEPDIEFIADDVCSPIFAEASFAPKGRDFNVGIEEIQDAVELALQVEGYYVVAKNYIKYRYDRELARSFNKELENRYNQVTSLISGQNEEANKENSNKDTRIIPTMRDYLAGFTCREMAEKFVLPKDIMEAHEEGLIHYHDTDYSPVMPMTNCCLINLEDMLQNGTVISGTMIEKPHSFRTACTITTQIIAQVASSQYGGNTISLAHLAPFVDVSRQNYKSKYPSMSNEDIEKIVRNEVKDGVQTIQYQLITISTTNGQAPFTSVFAYLDEVPNGQTRYDLAMIIEEVFKQRIQGVKNEKGVYVTTAFPKILYCLDEDNIHEDSEYWYLTKLAAECSAKRLVPDYISAKKMRELKEGNVFPCINKICA
nr:MAG TPA: anaerobic ribonucleoside triphosphate reductase [Caudoviricetes sp.]